VITPIRPRAIAAEIGLLREGRQVLTGAEISEMSDEDLRQQVKITDVFARGLTGAQNAYRRCFTNERRSCRHDRRRVNDAPSIKKSDIGVAMGITGHRCRQRVRRYGAYR